jgi:5-methylcytosine-specific restriction enzyme B
VGFMALSSSVIDSLTPSDKTRVYCRDNYIIPARVRGQKEVTIRSGDIHRELNFVNRLPLVCSALGSKKFDDLAGVKRKSIEGPTNGANTEFTFQIL